MKSIVYGQGLYVMTGNTPSGICLQLLLMVYRGHYGMYLFSYSGDYTEALFYEDGLFIVGGATTNGEYATSTNGTSWTRESYR